VEFAPLLLAYSNDDPILLLGLAYTNGVDPDFVFLLIIEDAESEVLGVLPAEGI